MAGALREGLHGKMLAQLPEEEIKEECSIAELMRRERAQHRAKEFEQKEKLRAKRRQDDAHEAAAAAAAATKLLDTLAKAREAEQKQLKRYEDELVELERKTKRFFDIVPDKRQAFKIRTNGVIYFGNFIDLGDDWLPHGFGEYRLPTGETTYEGEFARGLRHGQGMMRFENGDQWFGTFYKDEARGVGRYKWCQPEGSGPPVPAPRTAVFHGETLCAWLDELIAGKRIRVYSGPRDSIGSDATVIGGVAGKPSHVFYVHLDASGRREIVDVAHQRIELLVRQHLYYRFESTQTNRLSVRYDFLNDVATETPHNYNMFRPGALDVQRDKKDPAEEANAQRQAYDGRVAQRRKTKLHEEAKATLEDAILDRQRQALAEEQSEATLNDEISNEIRRRKTGRQVRHSARCHVRFSTRI